MVRRFMLISIFAVMLVAWGCSDNNTMAPDSGGPQSQASAGDVYANISPDLRSAIEQSMNENEEIPAVDPSKSQSLASGWSEITGPTTITEPGFYRVTSDFSASDDAIVIQSDWVFLSLGRFTITGPGDKMGRGVVLDNVNWVCVSGGNLQTFGMGVVLLNSMHTSVRRVHIVGGDVFADPGNGIAPQIGIMAVNSPNNLIFGNRIELLNLGIFIRGGGSHSNRVVTNRLMGGDLGLLAICYNPDGSGDPAGPYGDRVSLNHMSRFRGGIQANSGSHDNVFSHNKIKYFVYDVQDVDDANTFFANQSEQIDMPMSTLTLSFSGLEDLGPDYAYEGWVIVNGQPVTTGVFMVDGSGMMSQTEFEISSFDLAAATGFVLTIEPYPDSDPAPAETHYIGGDFSGDHASLSVSTPHAFGDDFTSAAGTYILNTPSTGSDDTDYHQGIWWLDPMGGFSPTLVLPALPNGWEYEGWVVGPDGPITTGKFTDVADFDSDAGGPTAGPDPTPPFPGQDYIMPPISLIGFAAVITVEPYPDNSTDPFTLKPLVDGNIEDVGIGVLQGMGNNAASFPTGSAMR
jgi:hypothetical protein